MPGITYDTGALIAAERNNRRIWALHRRALERGIMPSVPAAVLAQGWRGGPQPLMSRFLSACKIDDMDETRARSAGAVCGATGTSDVVDASVFAGAAAREDLVVTSDAGDLAQLRDKLGIWVEFQEI